jgi:hypothetical protein
MSTVDLPARLHAALREAFPSPLDEIRVEPGYGANLHAWVASPTFRGAPDYIRQDRVWDALRATVPLEDLARVSMILTFDPEEPEYAWALGELDRAS